MITQEEKRQFFATKKGPQHTVSMNGKKFSFNNLPEDTKKIVMDKLASKDEIQRQGQAGILPGIKIDGKQVTKDNISQFEIKTVVEIKEAKKEEPKKIELKVEPVIVKVEPKKEKKVTIKTTKKGGK